jgi:catechol 2,3-dioxygenase-like lactoylglutathione lyase family enzyme
MKLTYVRLLVGDFPASLKFYRDIIGLSAKDGGPDLPYAELAAGSVVLSLADRRMMAAAVGELSTAASGGPERVSLCFAVDSVDDEFARIRAAGATVVSAPADHTDWGIRTAHFRDPDGNLVEINKRID